MKYITSYKLFESIEEEFDIENLADPFIGNIISNHAIKEIPYTYGGIFGVGSRLSGFNIYILYGDMVLNDDEETLKEIYHYQKLIKSYNKEIYNITMGDGKIIIIFYDYKHFSKTTPWGNKNYMSDILFDSNINKKGIPTDIQRILSKNGDPITRGINYSNGDGSNMLLPEWKYE